MLAPRWSFKALEIVLPRVMERSTSKRAIKRAIGGRPLPLGQGVVARVIECEPPAQQQIAAILLAYDGLGSLHGDGTQVVVISTESQEQMLDEVLESIARSGVPHRVIRRWKHGETPLT